MLETVSGKDPIVAWRGWGIMHPHYLVSGNLVYEPRKRHEARCAKDHMCPDEKCSCGIYAFPSVEELRRQNYHTDGRYRVYGEAYLWGKVIEHANGYKAQYSYPKKLYFPDRLRLATAMDVDVVALAPYVAYLYGVPFEIIPPEHPIIVVEPRVSAAVKTVTAPGTFAQPTGRTKYHYWADPLKYNLKAKLPPQAAMLYQIIFDGMKTKSPFPEKDFIEALFAAVKTGKLRTRQDPWRIFAYYKPRLVADGFIKVVKK